MEASGEGVLSWSWLYDQKALGGDVLDTAGAGWNLGYCDGRVLGELPFLVHLQVAPAYAYSGNHLPLPR